MYFLFAEQKVSLLCNFGLIFAKTEHMVAEYCMRYGQICYV